MKKKKSHARSKRTDVRSQVTAGPVAGGDEPATMEWTAAQDFEACDITGLHAPSPEEWAEEAKSYAYVLRAALEVTGKGKAEAIERVRGAGYDATIRLIESFRDAEEFFRAWLAVIEAGSARYEVALSAAVVADRAAQGRGDVVARGTAHEPTASAERSGYARSAMQAERPRRDLLESYNAWLFRERHLLAVEMYPDMNPDDAERYVPLNNDGWRWHFRGPAPWTDLPSPSTRAAAILAAVGVIPNRSE